MTNAKIKPFLLFEGKAEEAINFYLSLFPGAKIIDIQRYGPGQPGPEGSVMKATFSVKDLSIMCTDSFAKHAFTFTPSISLFIECDEEEIERLAASLSEGGSTLMPLGNYGFSRKFTWVADRYGVSWQLNLA
jgi:predicted 3-demethylubiquinone-9 3-methyltransferase (glyoxalase superfamily)